MKLKNTVKQSGFKEVNQSQVKVVVNPQIKRGELLLSAQGLATDIALIFAGRSSIQDIPFVAMYRWEPELTNAETAMPSNSQQAIDTANQAYVAMQHVEHALARMIGAIDKKISQYLQKNTDMNDDDTNNMTIVVDSIKMIGGQKGDQDVAGTELYAQALKNFFITETYEQALKDPTLEEDSYAAMPRLMTRIEFERENFVRFPDIRFIDTRYLLITEGEQSIDVCIRVSSSGQLKFTKDIVTSVDEVAQKLLELKKQMKQLLMEQGTFRVTPANVISSSDPEELILVNANHSRTIAFRLFPPDETARRLGIAKRARAHSDSNAEQQDMPMGDGPAAKKARVEDVAPAAQAAPTNQDFFL